MIYFVNCDKNGSLALSLFESEGAASADDAYSIGYVFFPYRLLSYKPNVLDDAVGNEHFRTISKQILRSNENIIYWSKYIMPLFLLSLYYHLLALKARFAFSKSSTFCFNSFSIIKFRFLADFASLRR